MWVPQKNFTLFLAFFSVLDEILQNFVFYKKKMGIFDFIPHVLRLHKFLWWSWTCMSEGLPKIFFLKKKIFGAPCGCLKNFYAIFCIFSDFLNIC